MDKEIFLFIQSPLNLGKNHYLSEITWFWKCIYFLLLLKYTCGEILVTSKQNKILKASFSNIMRHFFKQLAFYLFNQIQFLLFFILMLLPFIKRNTYTGETPFFHHVRLPLGKNQLLWLFPADRVMMSTMILNNNICTK